MLSILLIAVSLSMDAFAVAVTNGIVVSGIRKKTLLLMALFFGGFQALMPVGGYFLGRAVSGYISEFDHWIAFLLLAFIGGRMFVEGLRGDGDEPRARVLTVPVLLLQAVATSIDALAVGVTMAFMDVNIWLSCGIIGGICFAATFAGGLLGKKVGPLLRKRAELAGGLVLIGIGAKILVEHLFFS